MSNLALILMWSAVLLTTIKAAELLEPAKPHLVPDGDATSVRFEAILMAITLITIAMLSILLADVIEPFGPYRLEAYDILKPPRTPPA